MFFYRRPFWGIGFKILMIFLLIAGGTFLVRSAFQAGYLQGVGAEGAEITGPMFHPYGKGYGFHYPGWGLLPFLGIFLGGILLIKLVTSIVGLVMFRRWKREGGPDDEDWKAWKSRRYHRRYHHPYHWHCGPYHPGMGPHPDAPEEAADGGEGEEAEA